MDMKKIEKIKASFTDEQNNLYNILLGDKEKLKAEWMLCRRMYDQAAAVIKAKETGIEVMMLLMKASTDYWNRRRLALERTLEEVGMNEDLAAWRKEADAKS
jgi:hypothetical protein